MEWSSTSTPCRPCRRRSRRPLRLSAAASAARRSTAVLEEKLRSAVPVRAGTADRGAPAYGEERQEEEGDVTAMAGERCLLRISE